MYPLVTGFAKLVLHKELSKVSVPLAHLSGHIILQTDAHEVSDEGEEIVSKLHPRAGPVSGNPCGTDSTLTLIFLLTKDLAAPGPTKRNVLYLIVVTFDNGSGVFRSPKGKAEPTGFGIPHPRF